jgi:hypothetical protein
VRATEIVQGLLAPCSPVFTYIDPAQFHELFAADLPGDQAAFMARSRRSSATEGLTCRRPLSAAPRLEFP